MAELKDVKMVVFDVETTGLMDGSRIVEIGATMFSKDEDDDDSFQYLVNPGMPIPEEVTKIHGVTNEMVESSPDAGKVLADFFDWLKHHGIETVIAHNAQYDTGIISWDAGRFGIEIPELKVICTCKVAKKLNVTKNNKLVTLAEHYRLKAKGSAHRALTDVDRCLQYYKLMDQATMSWMPLPWDEAGHCYQYTDKFPESLSDFPGRVENALPLRFKYADAKGAESERTIVPHGWSERKGKLFINGWCLMRKATRTFKADSIIEVIN